MLVLISLVWPVTCAREVLKLPLTILVYEESGLAALLKPFWLRCRWKSLTLELLTAPAGFYKAGTAAEERFP